MLKLTKIFHFETAHAIHGYDGACKNIHGHSYELHVTIVADTDYEDFIPAPGFIIDFKEIKKVVKEKVIQNFDHKLILSEAYITDHKVTTKEENLIIWKAEPTAENILLYIKQSLQKALPNHIQVDHLKLYETKDSYAEWCK
jgi:6-pyruvoyltetrahydropterin/6-carboxytetrahydropterin synthase